MVQELYEDGLTEEELRAVEQDRIERRQNAQKKMAWAAMVSMIVFTGVLVSPIVATDRLSIIADLVSLFYFAQAGVVGAYMGSEAIVNRSIKQDQNRRPRIGR